MDQSPHAGFNGFSSDIIPWQALAKTNGSILENTLNDHRIGVCAGMRGMLHRSSKWNSNLVCDNACDFHSKSPRKNGFIMSSYPDAGQLARNQGLAGLKIQLGSNIKTIDNQVGIVVLKRRNLQGLRHIHLLSISSII